MNNGAEVIVLIEGIELIGLLMELIAIDGLGVSGLGPSEDEGLSSAISGSRSESGLAGDLLPSTVVDCTKSVLNRSFSSRSFRRRSALRHLARRF